MVDTRSKSEVIPLHLSRPLADRTLRIMHAPLTEAEGRGYAVEAQNDPKRSEAVRMVATVIRRWAFPLALTKRTAKVPHEPTPQELRRQEHNPWTRLPKCDEEFNGRLALGAPSGSWYQHSYSYSDGARWTLESRIGHLLQDLERLVAEANRREQEKQLRESEQPRRGTRPSRAADRAAPGDGSHRADSGLAAGVGNGPKRQPPSSPFIAAVTAKAC
ncbi:hypothetical protein [Streptomyces sp. NPDC048172]|uniref:hypothetical protein n=1 Tax=Streptomyces sp. NPDC048172 TaxID=3365505 RepID=UPI00371BCC51